MAKTLNQSIGVIRKSANYGLLSCKLSIYPEVVDQLEGMGFMIKIPKRWLVGFSRKNPINVEVSWEDDKKGLSGCLNRRVRNYRRRSFDKPEKLIRHKERDFMLKMKKSFMFDDDPNLEDLESDDLLDMIPDLEDP